MQGPQSKIKDIDRLLSAYPTGNAADPKQTVRNYLLAVEDYHAADVTSAVDAFIKGGAPGVHSSFLPPASAVGAECRRQMNLRLDSEHRTKMAQPRLPPPDVERTPASQARVREMVAAVVAKLTESSSHAESDANRKAMIQRANRRFDAERGYEVGDIEDHEAAA